MLTGLLLVASIAGPATVLYGQRVPEFRILTPAGPLEPAVTLKHDHGFVAFPASELASLGFQVQESAGGITALWEDGAPRVDIRAGTPFLSWGGEGVQLAYAPYAEAGEVYVPLQFLVDVLPWKLPGHFQYESRSRTLQILGPGGTPAAPPTERVVVIDPGHGGRDSGARGPGGTQEKDVALRFARTLANVLREDPGLEVHLTRDSDTLIPLWKRGERATAWKGDRPGIFISIHANAMPSSRSTRGFETYFLSEARTEHERRVAALENAAQEWEQEEDASEDGSDLTFILSELRNLDTQHWSALLADLVQGELSRVHPGPNRGVKQGPFAVITNALMPAVLLEVGFVSNPAEERLLGQEAFQQNTARAVARAVQDFFRRYPPGTNPLPEPE